MKRARRRRALPPHVIEDVVKRTGQVRVYYRAPDLRRHQRGAAVEGEPPRKIRIWVSVEHEGFWEAYEAAKRGEQLPKPKKEKAKKETVAAEDTFAGLCTRFYNSAYFKGLSPSTQEQKRRTLTLCCKAPLGSSPELKTVSMAGCPIDVFAPKHIKWLMDCCAGKPEAANHRLKVVRGLFAWHQQGTDARNPCTGIKKLDPNNADGFHIWTVEEVEKYEAHHPIGSNARLAFDLARFTTQRKGEVAKLGPSNVFMRNRRAWLRLQQSKTRRKTESKGVVEIPIIEPLVLSIAARPKITPRDPDKEAFLMTSFRKPYTANGLGNAMRDWCDEAGLPHCTMHGLRKATTSMFAELGVSEEGIGSVTGHVPGSRSLPIYTRGARRAILAERAFEVLQEQLTKRASERTDPAEIAELGSHFISGPVKSGTYTQGELV